MRSIQEYHQIARAAIWDHHAQQKEDELVACMRFMEQNNVKTVIEIGSDAGGTLFAWSKLELTVYAVDLWHGGFSSGNMRHNHGASVINGNSHDPATYRELLKVIDGKVDFLFIDGDHTYSGISNDFWMYKHLVRLNGYIAIHDINPLTEKVNDIRVHQFWDYLIEEYPQWKTWEFKEFPYTWGGIGIVQVDESVRTCNTVIKCEDRYIVWDGQFKGMILDCDFPKDHNIGVSSQHHCNGLYWW